MKLYILSSRGYQCTDGMDKDTVIKLLTDLGATIATGNIYVGAAGIWTMILEEIV